MRISLDLAQEIAKRVNKQLRDWDISISVRPNFIVMVSLVVRELRREARKSKENREKKACTCS